jgi:hypothetical protein
MNDFDSDGIALGTQLGLQVSTWDEFIEKIEAMNLTIGLYQNGDWVVVDSNQNVLATLA